MSELFTSLSNVNVDKTIEKHDIVKEVHDHILANDYKVLEVNHQKPWGAYFRLDHSDVDAFVEEFFPNMTASEARLGNDDLELSPKILLVSPGEKLSWQYHNRRAEAWSFLHQGIYSNSLDDEEREQIISQAGDVVSFDKLERHRLIGCMATYTLVAEIWQHIDPANPSDEGDIVRLHDEYGRNK